jgi:hypothetical protein
MKKIQLVLLFLPFLFTFAYSSDICNISCEEIQKIIQENNNLKEENKKLKDVNIENIINNSSIFVDNYIEAFDNSNKTKENVTAFYNNLNEIDKKLDIREKQVNEINKNLINIITKKKEKVNVYIKKYEKTKDCDEFGIIIKDKCRCGDCTFNSISQNSTCYFLDTGIKKYRLINSTDWKAVVDVVGKSVCVNGEYLKNKCDEVYGIRYTEVVVF